MPVIPTFDPAPLAPNPAPLPRLDPAVGGEVGAALAQGGRQFAGPMEAFAQRYADAKRQTQAASIVADTSQKLGDAQFRWSKVPDRAAATAGYQQEANALTQSTLGGISDPLVKAHVADRIGQEAVIRGLDTQNAAFQLESSTNRGALDTRLEQYAQSAAGTSNDLLKAKITDDAMADIKGSVAAGWLHPEEGAQHQILFRSRAQEIAAEQQRNAVVTSQDPRAARAYEQKINDPAQFPGLNPQVREQLGYKASWLADRLDLKAQRAEDEAATRARIGMGRQYENATAMVERGLPAPDLPSDAQIAAAFPRNPEAAEDFAGKVRDLRAIGNTLSLLPGATPDQVAAMRAGAAPDPAHPETFARRAAISTHLDRALALRDKALGEDPAGYVLATHPEIQAGFAAAAKDPAQLPAYADKMLGLQAQMGVPESDRHLLPVQASQALARDIIGDPEHAPAKLKSLEQQYGGLWPQAWRDLTTVQGGLPASFQAVGALDDEGQAALLARGLAEQGKSGKSLTELLPPKAKSGASGMDVSIESAPELRRLLSSLSASGASAGMQSDVLNSVKTLAYANVVYGGKDPAAAADTALTAFIGKYEFMPNGGARVPRDRFDAVSANAAATLRDLDDSKVAIPGLYGRPGMPKPEDYLNLVKSAPSWVTAPSADALWLMDHYGRVVRDRAGKPVAVPFAAPAPASSFAAPTWEPGG